MYTQFNYYETNNGIPIIQEERVPLSAMFICVNRGQNNASKGVLVHRNLENSTISDRKYVRYILQLTKNRRSLVLS